MTQAVGNRCADTMVGILVFGNNHLILRGPLPEREVALALARHWTLIQIGSPTPPELKRWQIVTREFRENLKWAAIVEEDTGTSPAVATLLSELSARGIAIHKYRVRAE